MAEQSHGNFSGDEVACKLAHFSATGGDEGNRRPLDEGRSFCGFSFTECHQSSRHKFSPKSRASGLQTHSHSSTDRLRFRFRACSAARSSRSARILRGSCALNALPSVITKGAYGAIRSVSVSLWKAVWSRNRDQPPSFLFVCATLFFSFVA